MIFYTDQEIVVKYNCLITNDLLTKCVNAEVKCFVMDGGQNQVLVDEVERVFTSRNWRSLQQAEIATGVPASTIQRLRRGAAVKADTIIRFGVAVGEDKEKWGRIAVGLSPTVIEPSVTVDSSAIPDPLAAIGEELDPRPYIAALRDIVAAGAGWERQKDVDAPGADALIGPIRVFRISGDCMEPVLHDGDEILIAPPDTVRDGDIVTATVDIGTVTCKQICIPADGSSSYLVPINGEGQIEEGRFVVTGVVKRVIEDIRARLRRYRHQDNHAA